jgi:cell division protein FtsQ
MNSTIDRRIAARRRVVREAGARKRLRWLLGIMLFAGAAAFAAWLFYYSSILSVRTIVVEGSEQSATSSILASQGVNPGVPTISVSAARIEAALEADPWVARADVRITWPGSVEVTVVEHVPAAWVAADGAWLLASGTGAVVASAPSIPTGAPVIDVAIASGAPGDTLTDAATVGALEFLGSIPPELALGSSVTGTADHLEARIAGHVVDLGHPSDMAAKAAALLAIVETGVPDGARLSVVSPRRPAILNPQAVLEGSGEDPPLTGEPG